MLIIVIKTSAFPLFSSQSYMMVVSWSDQNNILIYRTFEDFKKFHVSEHLPENRILRVEGMEPSFVSRS